jgi:integrase
MPRLGNRLPVPRLHKPSGRARVRIDGRDHWLGKFGSLEAQARYDRLIADYLTHGRKIPTTPTPTPVDSPASIDPTTTTVTILVCEFTKWARSHYRGPDGTPTREADNFKLVTRPLRRRFGTLPVAVFGPARLLEFRSSLVERGLARRTVNDMVRRLRRIFRWGVERELVSPEVLARLEAVSPLQPGRGGRETTGSRGMVGWPLVEATLPSLPPLLRAFVVVAYHTGARRGELAKLTTGMIDATGEVWVADLVEHKTSSRGKARRIFIGPKAQAALGPWLLPDEPDTPIFSPRRVDGRQMAREGKRLPGRTYNRSSLDQVLRRAIRRAGVASWTLGQLRHSAAVRIADALDLEAARQALGHSTMSMSRHYTSGSTAGAIEAARRVG